MFALKALMPLLDGLDQIEAGYRDGEISKEELQNLGKTMNKITGSYYWDYVLDGLTADWMDRYKTLAEKAQEAELREQEKAEAKAKAEALAIEAAKPKMIEYLPSEDE